MDLLEVWIFTETKKVVFKAGRQSKSTITAYYPVLFVLK